jgi:hypothetical protein
MRLGAGGASSSIVHHSWSVVHSVIGHRLSAPTYPPCEQWLAAAGVGVGAMVDGWWVVVGWALAVVSSSVVIHRSLSFVHCCHLFIVVVHLSVVVPLVSACRETIELMLVKM